MEDVAMSVKGSVGGYGRRKRIHHRNLRRVDRYGDHGWVVSVKRRGRRRVEHFADRVHGGREAALLRAIQRRDELEASLPPPVKLKTRYSLNKTGVVGVFLEVRRLRLGPAARYYGATWTELSGKRMRVRFLASRYGEREARHLAIRARQEAVARILKARGARVYWQR